MSTSSFRSSNLARNVLNSPMMDYETPGNPALKEEIECFNHKYYERSMRIIDLLITGKENLINSQNLLTKINLRKVFFEEPMEGDSTLKDALIYGSQQDIEWSKQTQKRKFIDIK